jgi:preprotein translocase subunit SecA
MNFLFKIFGDPIAAYLKKLSFKVAEINKLEGKFAQFSDAALRKQTEIFKERLAKNETLNDLLPEAFAVVREAAKRTLNQRHFDVQLIGGIVLHEGKIAEMATGEGKTLTATLPLYLNALEGKGVHLVTVNDYLAKRDVVWMGQIYHFLGLSVGCLTHDQAYVYDPIYSQSKDLERDLKAGFKVFEDFLRPVRRQEAYLADITYGTNNEFGFDYLRDNMVTSLDQQVQRGHHFAIVDEVDSILIDEARTPLIISQPDLEAANLYQEFASIVPLLKENQDYNVDEKAKVVTLTEEGILKVEKIVGVDNIYAEKGMRYLHYLEQALRAHVLFKRDRDYVVKDGEIIIIDEFTGRLLPGRRYSEGLHQAIEAKEGVPVRPESKTLATITFQNYFRLYKKLAGMTGTALTSAEEFDRVYHLEVVPIPTNKPLIRKILPDKVYKTQKAKFLAVVKEVKERHQRGQPVLIGTTSIEKNEYLSRLLTKEGIPHNVLNAKNHEKEAEIIAQAGKLGAVTCATNMAGRGVDIILGGNPPSPAEAQKVRELGGLCVIGTERHEARRIDNQLQGRTGRQGDPGVAQFFLSLEDDLLRIFGSERVKALMEKFNFPEDQPIENKIISKVIQEAQAKIEGLNFDIRKHLLEYDEVLNKHREVIYRKRKEILQSSSFKEKILELAEKEIEKILNTHCGEMDPQNWNIEEIVEEVKTIMPSAEIRQNLTDFCLKKISNEEIIKEMKNFLKNLFEEFYSLKEKEFGAERMRQIEKWLALNIIDFLWVDHLTTMDHLRDSVRLRAWGQKDPLVEYKSEGHRFFKILLETFESNLVRTILKVEIRKEPLYQRVTNSNLPPQFKNVGRNDPCPCGSGKKFKKCHGRY